MARAGVEVAAAVVEPGLVGLPRILEAHDVTQLYGGAVYTVLGVDLERPGKAVQPILFCP